MRAAAKVSIDELAVEVGRLTKGLDSIRGELAHFEKEAAKTADDGERVGERFAAVMAPFAESAAQQLEELRRAEAAMELERVSPRDEARGPVLLIFDGF